MSNVTWDQMTEYVEHVKLIVEAATAAVVILVPVICIAIVKVAPFIKDAVRAVRDVADLKEQVSTNTQVLAAHKETIVNLAEESPGNTKDLLQPLVAEQGREDNKK